jgi:lipopolysaccharide export system protein LptA
MKSILIAILFFVPVWLVAQQVRDTLATGTHPKKRIHILNSDYTKSIESDSGSILRFRGNVKMEHESTIMDCDSALLWPNGIFEAFGNTKITKNTTVVTGDMMIYNETESSAKVTGRIVYLTDGGSILKTTEVDFNT